MQSNPLIAELAKPLAVGPIDLPNRVFLAPMSGISDVPFRAIASAYGAGLVVSEMVASEMLARGDAESLMRAERAGTGAHVIQLAGREARWMAEGARAATDAGADIIDINMGCPAKKVTGGYSGSALMRDLDHALTLIEATVAATPLPVTLKMRLGWDDGTVNAPELARRAEAGRRPAHCRSRAHALPVLLRRRRLGGDPRGEGCGLHPAHRQRRSRCGRGSRTHASALRCGRRDDRSWGVRSPGDT